MDFHFVRPQDTKKSQSADAKKIGKIAKTFLPLFLLAAILPFLLGFVVSPPKLGLFTRAGEAAQLRVWLEPANVVMDSGSQTVLSVVAGFESETKLIPEISLQVTGTEALLISSPTIIYQIPFKGRVRLGEVTVTATAPGQAQVDIPEDLVAVTAFGGPLEIVTSPATIMIR